MDIVGEVNDFNTYQRALVDLSSDTSQVPNEKIIGILERLEHFLNGFFLKLHLLESAVEGATENELAFFYENFIPVTFTIVDDIRQVILETDENGPLLDKLSELKPLVDNIIERQLTLRLVALKAWRKQNPRFSSAGILDSDLQSATLKDVKFARR